MSNAREIEQAVLSEKDPNRLSDALLEAGRQQLTHLLPQIAGMAEHPDEIVRIYVLRSIFNFMTQSAEPYFDLAIDRLLNDPSNLVRSEAADSFAFYWRLARLSRTKVPPKLLRRVTIALAQHLKAAELPSERHSTYGALLQIAGRSVLDLPWELMPEHIDWELVELALAGKLKQGEAP